MFTSPTRLLILVLAVLAALGGLLGGIYVYGARQYSLGVSTEHARQEAATAVLNANLEAYEVQASANQEALQRARETLAAKIGIDVANLPPQTGCDYPEPIRSELNAITIGRRK